MGRKKLAGPRSHPEENFSCEDRKSFWSSNCSPHTKTTTTFIVLGSGGFDAGKNEVSSFIFVKLVVKAKNDCFKTIEFWLWLNQIGDLSAYMFPTLSPKHRSAKFLMSMFVVFFALTDPASRKAKPACISNMTEPITVRKKSSRLPICRIFFSNKHHHFCSKGNKWLDKV